MTIHICRVLRGNRVTDGIEIEGGAIPFRPQWGLAGYRPKVFASTTALDGRLTTVRVAITAHGPVLVPADGEPARELVLVQQYRPGCGGKRWPAFYVEVGDEAHVLDSVSTSGGSGGEHWLLVSAPLGWAENISKQFTNQRDVGAQTIVFRP